MHPEMNAITRCLPQVLHDKYGPPEAQGRGPRLRHRFGYATPDDWYEAALLAAVTESTSWLDVGSGRHVLPFNPRLARALARRCRMLVGIDPAETIEHNTVVHQRIRCGVEELGRIGPFDLVSLRMVAEHLPDPAAAVAAITGVVAPGGRVIVYTVHRFSPVTALAGLLPGWLLRPAQRLVSGGPRPRSTQAIIG